jgi:hypothetical protein
LAKKAREAMLSAVQIHNNPQIDFKSELFIVTSVIAWTYLLHAYYHEQIAAALGSEGLPPRSGRSWNAIVVNRILRVQARGDAEAGSAIT